MEKLTSEQLRFWNENGYLLLKGYFSGKMKQDLADWVGDLERRPETPGKWMKYFERSAISPGSGRLLCRVEDFLPYHDGLRELLTGDAILSIVSELMGESAVLFKEKINYKLAGGGGFASHQDAPAFVTFGQKYHITLMVGIDDATPENGCLEMVRGRHKEGIFPQSSDKTIDPQFAETLDWEYLPTQAGDVLFFDSYIPHRSGPNLSGAARRALYVTYNRKSEGERRDDYYADKRMNFPPEIERIPGKDYSSGAAIYNVGNPIQTESRET